MDYLTAASHKKLGLMTLTIQAMTWAACSYVTVLDTATWYPKPNTKAVMHACHTFECLAVVQGSLCILFRFCCKPECSVCCLVRCAHLKPVRHLMLDRSSQHSLGSRRLLVGAHTAPMKPA